MSENLLAKFEHDQWKGDFQKSSLNFFPPRPNNNGQRYRAWGTWAATGKELLTRCPSARGLGKPELLRILLKQRRCPALCGGPLGNWGCNESMNIVPWCNSGHAVKQRWSMIGFWWSSLLTNIIPNGSIVIQTLSVFLFQGHTGKTNQHYLQSVDILWRPGCGFNPSRPGNQRIMTWPPPPLLGTTLLANGN